MIAFGTDSAAWLQFFGRLHPLVLHLPIGLWVGAAFVEFGSALCRRPAPRGTVASLAWLATLTAGLAAGAGWVLAMEPGYDSRPAELHRWLGLAVAGTGLLAALLSLLAYRRPFRLLLLVVLGLMLPAAHVGNTLTRSEDFLTEPFAERDPPADPAAATGEQPVAPAAGTANGALTFASAVLPIFQRTCTKCHGATRDKGELRLHHQTGIEQGGENGAVLIAGKPDESPLLQRVLLPIDDEDHMPKKGKPQPTAAEIATLRAWIAAGAPFTEPFTTGATDASTPGGESPPKVEPATVPDPVRGNTSAPTDPGKGEGEAGNLVIPKLDPATPSAGNQEPAKQTTPPAPAANEGTPSGNQPPPTGTEKPKAPTDPAYAAAIAALRQRLVHVADAVPGEHGLWLDFAAIAPTLTEAEAKTLLEPVAPHIVELGLSRVPVGDDMLTLCARMPRLQRLDLRNTSVTSKGLLHLTALPALRELVLVQTKLDDEATTPLLAMPALAKVYVWNAGLSPAAIEALRQKEGLHVNAGEEPPAKALETEGELKFKNDLPPPGQPAPAVEAAAALRPVNNVCPVSGKPVDPRYVIVHEQRAVGFCCPNCPKAFWAEPDKYTVKPR